MKDSFSLRLLGMHLVEYLSAHTRKTILSGAEDTSRIIGKLVILTIILFLLPVFFMLTAFLVVVLMQDLFGLSLTVSLLIALGLQLLFMILLYVCYKPLTRSLRNSVKRLFIRMAQSVDYAPHSTAQEDTTDPTSSPEPLIPTK